MKEQKYRLTVGAFVNKNISSGGLHISDFLNRLCGRSLITPYTPFPIDKR
jgi:hypothetical protein